jgi:hypothetical protein
MSGIAKRQQMSYNQSMENENESDSSFERKNNVRRKSKSDAELWDRRLKEFQLWTQGISIREISRYFGIDEVVVGRDLKKIAMLDDVKEVKGRLNGILLNLCRRSYRRLAALPPDSHVATQWAKIILEVSDKLARLHGFTQDNFVVNNTMIQNNVRNAYDGMTETELSEEWKRRKLLKSRIIPHADDK